MNEPLVVSGNDIAERAKEAITATYFLEPGTGSKLYIPTGPSMCQMFARMVLESLYGTLFDEFRGATALASMQLWREDGRYTLKPSSILQRGDLLYKGLLTSGRAGHVGILGAGGMVYENSEVHYTPEHKDARGTRSLAAFGQFELIVRPSIYSKGKG